MTSARRRRAERDAVIYRWRTVPPGPPGVPGALERIGHSSWVPELLVHLFAIVAALVVAATWLLPAITAGFALGWDTTLDGGPVRAAGLSGPAWLYALFGAVFFAIGVSGVPYAVRENRRLRRPVPILRLAPDHLAVQTLRDVRYPPGDRKPRFREAYAALEWRDIEEVEPSRDPDDGRPTLVVRGSAAAHLGLPVSPDDEVRIRIRGDGRDVPVIVHFLAKRRRRPQLGSAESLRVARQLSSST